MTQTFITDDDVSAANKDGVAGTASMRTLGTGAQQATAGNDSRLSDSRAPSGSAGGDLSSTYPNPVVKKASKDFSLPGYLIPTSLSSNKDDWNPTDLNISSLVAISSTTAIQLRGLQTGVEGRIIILFNVGNFDITLVSASGTSSPANRFSLAADLILGSFQSVVLRYFGTLWYVMTPPRYLFGSAAQTMCEGNDARLSDARSPTAHGSTHQDGGGDEIASFTNSGASEIPKANRSGFIDPSFLEFGTHVGQICQGSDSRLSDSRAPNGAAGGDLSGTYPNPVVKLASLGFSWTADITPTQITSNQNDYAPTGGTTVVVWRINSNSAVNITGLSAGQTDGKILILYNTGSFAITLTRDDAASSANNRILMPAVAGFVLGTDQCVFLQWDSTSSRWRILGCSRLPFGTAANTICQGNDSRLSDSRAPNGSAGGDLTGTYPNPTFNTSVVTAAAKTVLDDATVSDMVDTLGGAAATGSSGLVRKTSPAIATPTLTAPIIDEIINVRPMYRDSGGIQRDLPFWHRRSLRQWTKNPAQTTYVNDAAISAPTVTSPGGAAASGDTITQPMLTISTGAVTNNIAEVITATFNFHRRCWSPTLRVPFRTPGAITNIRMWIGFFNGSLGAVGTPTTQHVAAFRYDTGVDGTVFWRCITCDGASNVTTTTTTVAVVAGTESGFRIEIDGSNVAFYIDDVRVALHTTNLPGNTTNMGHGATTTTLANVDAQPKIGTFAWLHT